MEINAIRAVKRVAFLQLAALLGEDACDVGALRLSCGWFLGTSCRAAGLLFFLDVATAC